MGTITLSDLRTNCRQSADMERSSKIQDTELTRYINNSIKDLYDKLINAYGDEYFESTSDISLVSGTQNYSLPSDFYKLITANMKTSTGREYPLQKLNSFSSAFRGLTNIYGGTVRLHYIPTFTNLSAPTDTWDEFNGWGEYVELDVAMKMKIKEDEDVTDLMNRFIRIDERIDRIAKSRDIGQFHQVIDVRGKTQQYPIGYMIKGSNIAFNNTFDRDLGWF